MISLAYQNNLASHSLKKVSSAARKSRSSFEMSRIRYKNTVKVYDSKVRFLSGEFLWPSGRILLDNNGLTQKSKLKLLLNISASNQTGLDNFTHNFN